jgi:hypothetical protein
VIGALRYLIEGLLETQDVLRGKVEVTRACASEVLVLEGSSVWLEVWSGLLLGGCVVG